MLSGDKVKRPRNKIYIHDPNNSNKKQGRKWLPKSARLAEVMNNARYQAEAEYEQKMKEKAMSNQRKVSPIKDSRRCCSIRSAKICRAKFQYYETLLVDANRQEQITIDSLKQSLYTARKEIEEMELKISTFEQLAESAFLNDERYEPQQTQYTENLALSNLIDGTEHNPETRKELLMTCFSAVERQQEDSREVEHECQQQPSSPISSMASSQICHTTDQENFTIQGSIEEQTILNMGVNEAGNFLVTDEQAVTANYGIAEKHGNHCNYMFNYPTINTENSPISEPGAPPFVPSLDLDVYGMN